MIDCNDDKKCDYTYNFSSGLLTYYEYLYQKFIPLIEKDLQAKEDSGFELLIILAALAMMILYYKRKR